ncbi:MAG: hypothetical protein JO224_09435 [Pelomonas sp.]|nr:hypothetical protein [Roseateles sp.]
MILQNRQFQCCVALTIVQQLALAASTYLIALAGGSLAANDVSRTRYLIVLFFGFALGAYLIGSLVTYLTTRLKNSLWRNYVLETLETLKFDQTRSSRVDQQRTIGWLGGEAFSTLEQAGEFAVGTVGIYCNVVLTFAAFALTLGAGITAALASAVLVSLALTRALRHRIRRLARESQSSRLDALVDIGALWDRFLFADSRIAARARKRFVGHAARYFAKIERCVVTEQLIACLPIYVAIPLALAVMVRSDTTDPVTMGMIVAVLPRSLQLLGSIHELSVSNSKVFFFVEKLRNLAGFVATLEVQALEQQIRWAAIRVTDLSTGLALDAHAFYRSVSAPGIARGRFRLTGANGCGKTSLLKLIKQARPEALYCAQDVRLVDDVERASTGQRQVRQLEILLSAALPTTLLLDEWDANLDAANAARVDRMLEARSSALLIVEVRHLSAADATGISRELLASP